MDIQIKHKLGSKNANADALSRNLSQHTSDVAVVNAEDNSICSDSLSDLEVRTFQMEDKFMALMIEYLQTGALPDSDKDARRLVMESRLFQELDGVLYFENKTLNKLCIVVPEKYRDALLEEAHAGRFAGHLGDKKVYDRLRRYYWWRGMRGDVRKFCRSCLVCASRKGTRKTFRPPLQPIPVGGPFHRVGVDILQLPLTAKGNQYVAVFVDYLTKWPEAFPIPDQKAETIAHLLLEHIVCTWDT